MNASEACQENFERINNEYWIMINAFNDECTYNDLYELIKKTFIEGNGNFSKTISLFEVSVYNKFNSRFEVQLFIQREIFVFLHHQMKYLRNKGNKKLAKFCQSLLEYYLNIQFPINEVNINITIGLFRYHFNEKSIEEGLKMVETKSEKRKYIKITRNNLDEFSKHPSSSSIVKKKLDKEIKKYRKLLKKLDELYKVNKNPQDEGFLEIININKLKYEKFIGAMYGMLRIRRIKDGKIRLSYLDLAVTLSIFRKYFSSQIVEFKKPMLWSGTKLELGYFLYLLKDKNIISKNYNNLIGVRCFKPIGVTGEWNNKSLGNATSQAKNKAKEKLKNKSDEYRNLKGLESLVEELKRIQQEG
jgi:hypothetical protein